MKFLRNRKDGFVISYHEGLSESPLWEVIEAKAGENPQPDEFLAPSDIEARDAKPTKAEKAPAK